MASRSLIVLPDDAATPILEAIGEAKTSLSIKMFVFSDPALLGARHRRQAPRRARSRDAQPGAPQR